METDFSQIAVVPLSVSHGDWTNEWMKHSKAEPQVSGGTSGFQLS